MHGGGAGGELPDPGVAGTASLKDRARAASEHDEYTAEDERGDGHHRSLLAGTGLAPPPTSTRIAVVVLASAYDGVMGQLGEWQRALRVGRAGDQVLAAGLKRGLK